MRLQHLRNEKASREMLGAFSIYELKFGEVEVLFAGVLGHGFTHLNLCRTQQFVAKFISSGIFGDDLAVIVGIGWNHVNCFVSLWIKSRPD